MWYCVCPGIVKSMQVIRGKCGCKGATVCAWGCSARCKTYLPYGVSLACGVCQYVAEHMLSLGSLYWVMTCSVA